MRKKKLMTVVITALMSVTTICGAKNMYAAGIEPVYEEAFYEVEFDDGACIYSILEDGTIRIDYYDSDRTEIVLPGEIDGKKVTVIGEYGLYENKTVEKVTIPDGVTIIGNKAFENCTSLKEVEFSETIESFGNSVFYNCDSLEYVELPANTTNIGSSMFSDCDNLKEIVIPKEVTDIEMYAFSGCESLERIVIPANVTYIGEYAFKDCENLKNIELNEGLKTIEMYAFDSCKSLEEITIPNSVTTLGKGAFYACSNLKEIEILANLNEISASTFYECRSLENIDIPEGVTEIGNSAFYNCFALKEAKLPETLTTLGHKAFYNCTDMKSIYIPGNVTYEDGFAIGYYEDEYWEDGENWLGSFPIKDFIIYGYRGTKAENMALMFTFIALDSEEEITTELQPTEEKESKEEATTEETTVEKSSQKETAQEEITEQVKTSKHDVKVEGVAEDVRLEISQSSEDEIKKVNKAAMAVDVLTGKKLLVLDLKLYKNNKNIQPDGKIKITLPVEELYKNGEYVAVYRLDSDRLTYLGTSSVTENAITFETDHFSTYVFAKLSVMEAQTEEITVADTENATVDGKTQTGENKVTKIIIISMIAFVGGAVLVITKLK